MAKPFSSFPQPQLPDQPTPPVQPPSPVKPPSPVQPPPPVQPPALSQGQLAPPAAPPAQSFPSRSQEPLNYKNRLQEFAQRSSIPLPVYQTFNTGSVHAPRFRSTVIVEGISYTSDNAFSQRKAAEQAVAKYALECVPKNLKDKGCHLLREDTVLCKSILNEFAVKMDLETPAYTTVQSGGLLPHFVSSIVFNGVTYRGEARRSKKEAERLAARAVILSLLEDPKHETSLLEIVNSKSKFYAALNKGKDSSIFHLGTTNAGADTSIHNNKEAETAAVSNSVCVPTSASLQQSSESGHPHHEFRIPKSEQVTESIHLPIAFVPPMVEHVSDFGGNPSRKRGRKKKKAKLDTKLAAAASVPLNQTASCSVAL